MTSGGAHILIHTPRRGDRLTICAGRLPG